MTARHTPRIIAAAVVAAVLALAGCSTSDETSSVAAQAKRGDSKGYVSGDGTIERIAVGKRADPVALSGKTLEGKTWSSAEQRGKVVVVNVWGSWCPPCVTESPDLQKAWASFEKPGRKVAFVGIDVRESAATGLAFTRSRGITYPSLSDESGALVLALQGKVAAQPTTLVLDTEGRIAARVSGPVDRSTITGLVDDVLSGNTA